MSRESRRRLVDRPQKRDQGRALRCVGDKVVLNSAVGVLRPVQDFLERLGEAAVKVRRRLVHA